ncbi:MAG: acyl--CoA ligase, partial [Candidatus Eremiobacteraeota bacterium]|nr:acyl--CoA ligase [Candidatus Eremiobacteraeota bacterium]
MLLDLFDGALADRPESLALDELTFRQFHDRANHVARRLAQTGVGRGDRVVIYCENRLGLALSYVAALRLGAIAVPINPLYRRVELSHVLRDAEPALVVHSATVARWLADAGSGGVPQIGVEEVESWKGDSRLEPALAAGPNP